MNPLEEESLLLTRRRFFQRSGLGLSTAALAALLEQDGYAQETKPALPHFAPKAKRVIYLFQAGGPSQLELFDYKPQLARLRGQNLPDSVRQGQRLTGMSAHQTTWHRCLSSASTDSRARG
jgi:hypothetical protein